MEIIYDRNEIDKAAEQFLELLKQFKVYCFSGDLGAGKTTFITALCKQLGITESVTSPTYSIIQEYGSEDSTIVYHLDLYRLKSEWEAVEAGVEDILHSGHICLVEWPEKVPKVIPENSVMIQIEVLGAASRKLIMKLPT